MGQNFKAYLAAKLLIDSPWTENAIRELLNSCRSRKVHDLGTLAATLVSRHPTPPSFHRLVEFLSRGTKPPAYTLLSLRRLEFALMNPLTKQRKMRAQLSDAPSWAVPRIDSVSELSELLNVSTLHLDWLSANYANHYTIIAVRKRSGGIRIIESPKLFLKRAQRVVLKHILNGIPAHSCAHGFVRSRSAISFVEPHINKPFLLRMDLQDCFPSVDANRVWGLFRSLGYPVDVIQSLTAICTCYTTPSLLTEAMSGIEAINGYVNAPEQNRILSLHHRKHLPQGAPTSPKLLNLIAYRLDCRLASLAEASGATYTRYADDLLFSGNEQFARSSESFATRVGAIVLEEGFQLNYRKTRRMHKSTRQLAAGIVVNQKTNIRRVDFDALKATLNNCVRNGPQCQNRDSLPNFRSHLLGRILWVNQLNKNRGEKLMQIFERIDWGV